MTSINEDVSVLDQELVAAAQCGCIRSFELLVERYYEPILVYLMRRVSDCELASDLAQETFLDAFRALDRLAKDRPFAPWLYRIAHNNFLNAYRQRRLHHTFSLNQLTNRNGSGPAAPWSISHTIDCEERDEIQQVLNTLTPTLRDALLLHSLGGFPGQEVAQILGISSAAARQRIGRAKAEFRVEYDRLNNINDIMALTM